MNNATIVLLGATSSGSETLKNLVLPAVRRFIIVDDAKVEKRDLGNNFFLTEDDVGKSRATVMKDYLHELNPDDTEGIAVEKSIAEFIADTSHKWGDEYSLIIGTDLDNSTVKKVAERCTNDITAVQQRIPFVLIRQYGLIGYMRIITDEVAVAEQKPFAV